MNLQSIPHEGLQRQKLLLLLLSPSCFAFSRFATAGVEDALAEGFVAGAAFCTTSVVNGSSLRRPSCGLDVDSHSFSSAVPMRKHAIVSSIRTRRPNVAASQSVGDPSACDTRPTIINTAMASGGADGGGGGDGSGGIGDGGGGGDGSGGDGEGNMGGTGGPGGAGGLLGGG